MPSEREGHSVTVIDRYMLMFGGWNSDNGNIFDEIYIFDSVSSIWRLVESKYGVEISARESLTVNYINGYVYLFGG